MTNARLIAVLIASLLALTGSIALSETKTNEREGGVIGTGIVGTVTELGSIIVNDQRVTFGPETMAMSALGGTPAASLTPGDTVVVVAEPVSGDWQATSIEQHFALVGPVQREGSLITVLGTTLDLSGAVDTAKTLASDLSNGDWVAVSGLWKGNTLMASKLVRAEREGLAVVSGSYFPDAAEQGFRIGNSAVSGLDLEHVEIGQIVTVTGRSEPGGIAADTVRIGLFSGPTTHVIAQGFMSKPTQDGLYTVLGSGAVSFTDQPEMIDTEIVGVYCIFKDLGSDGQVTMIPGGEACRPN